MQTKRTNVGALIGGSILLSLLRPATVEVPTGWVPGTAKPKDSSARKED